MAACCSGREQSGPEQNTAGTDISRIGPGRAAVYCCVGSGVDRGERPKLWGEWVVYYDLYSGGKRAGGNASGREKATRYKERNGEEKKTQRASIVKSDKNRKSFDFFEFRSRVRWIFSRALDIVSRYAGGAYILGNACRDLTEKCRVYTVYIIKFT